MADKRLREEMEQIPDLRMFLEPGGEYTCAFGWFSNECDARNAPVICKINLNWDIRRVSD